MLDEKGMAAKEVLQDIIRYAKGLMAKGMGDEDMNNIDEAPSDDMQAVEEPLGDESKMADEGMLEKEESPAAEVAEEMGGEEKDELKNDLRSFIKGSSPKPKQEDDGVTVSLVGMKAPKPNFAKKGGKQFKKRY